MMSGIDLNVIDNMFIVSPPERVQEAQDEQASETRDDTNSLLDFNDLDIDYLKEDWDEGEDLGFSELDMDLLDVDFLQYMREARNKKFQEFIAQISNEEAPANAAGGGNVAGLGVNGPSDVKVSRNVKHTLRRRKKRRV